MSTIPVKPNLRGTHSQAHRVLDERVLRGIGLMRAGAGILIEWDGNQYVVTSTARGGGGTSDSWPPVELDPTQSTPAGGWRYISPTNAIVTAGIYDLDAGAVITAEAGLWRARVAVPSEAIVGGVMKYNVPQDLGITGKWILIQPSGYC